MAELNRVVTCLECDYPEIVTSMEYKFKKEFDLVMMIEFSDFSASKLKDNNRKLHDKVKKLKLKSKTTEDLQFEIVEICKLVPYCPNKTDGAQTTTEEGNLVGWLQDDIADSGLAKLYFLLMSLNQQEVMLIRSESGLYWTYTKIDNQWSIQDAANICIKSYFYLNLSSLEFKPESTIFTVPTCDTMDFNYLKKRGWIIEDQTEAADVIKAAFINELLAKKVGTRMI